MQRRSRSDQRGSRCVLPRPLGVEEYPSRPSALICCEMSDSHGRWFVNVNAKTRVTSVRGDRDLRDALAGFLAIGAAFVAVAPADAQSILDAVTSGTPLLDVRLRYDHVDESDKPKDAEATTIRARAGYRTGSYEGFTALAEFDLLGHIGPKNFNDTIDHLTAYPVIADPDLATLNRLQLGYDARVFASTDMAPDVHVIAGRQEIVIGNQRFVGNAAWRQHEQTFDAISLNATPLPSTVLFYAYVNRVNRVFGPENPVGHYQGDTHLFDAVYTGLAHLRFEGYAYLYEFRNAPTLSTGNVGARATASLDLGRGVIATLDGEFAHQTDRANNALSISLNDFRAEGRLAYSGLSTTIGYEVSEGNGRTGFQTPLVSGHLFQGWAEMFVVKPPQGLNDLYVKASYTIAGPFAVPIIPSLSYHEFSAEHMHADYGNEWDFGVEAQFGAHVTADIAYADYTGAGPFPDKRELWLYATYHL
jgi:hypothetical protein